MFYNKGVLGNFTKSHMKTPVSECLFNKVAGLRQIKIEAPTRVFYCEYFEILNPQPKLNANKTSNEGLLYVQFRLYSHRT